MFSKRINLGSAVQGFNMQHKYSLKIFGPHGIQVKMIKQFKRRCLKILMDRQMPEKKHLEKNDSFHKYPKEQFICSSVKLLTLSMLAVTCCLLISFANSLEPDQDRHSGPTDYCF